MSVHRYMIAAFLKTPDGGFDIPGFAVSLGAFLFAVWVLCWTIPVTLRAGHTRAKYFWFGDVYDLDRVKTPKAFWCHIALLVVGSLGAIACAIVFSTGLIRGH
jgi:hypothetical protein